MRAVIGLVPDDDFARGRVDAVQTAATSAFHFAGTEQLCARISGFVIGGPLDVGLDPARADDAIHRLVEDLMGLPPAHSRHEPAILALRAHHQEARAMAGPVAALRSAFVVACQSPDLMGMGL